MKEIPLTQGKVALVDDADFEAVSKFNWRAQKVGRRIYAVRSVRKSDGKRTQQYMHKFLMPDVARVDHRDGNGLDNRREKNLRPATTKQNARGFQHKRLGTSSKFRGVCWVQKRLKWRASIDFNNKGIWIGYFDLEEDAARARDAAALKYFGKGAHLNFPL